MYRLQFDGASRGNPGPASSAAVLLQGDQMIHYAYTPLKGKMTNNQAEYMGLIVGLRMAIQQNIPQLHIEGDSQLVIQQLFGTWKCQHPKMKPLYQEVKRLLKSFTYVDGKWIPREKNSQADHYCNQALNTRTSHGEELWFQMPTMVSTKPDLRNYFESKS